MNIIEADVMAVVKRIEDCYYGGADRIWIYQVVPRLKWVDFHRLMARLEERGVIGKDPRTHNFILLSKTLDMDYLTDCNPSTYVPEWWVDSRWMKEEEYLSWCEKQGFEPDF